MENNGSRTVPVVQTGARASALQRPLSSADDFSQETHSCTDPIFTKTIIESHCVSRGLPCAWKVWYWTGLIVR